MLRRLVISNYALIDNVQLSFENGFSVITGETGAGKSILLKALNLLLGERADSEVLKQNEQKCFLEAEFDLSQLNLASIFEQLEMDFENITIIRREFSKDGKSRCFVNDSPVPQSSLKDLGQYLIAIHSQHDNTAITLPEFQLELVDSFARIGDEVRAYRQTFRSFQKLKQRHLELKLKDLEGRKEKDYLNFLVHEFSTAKLSNLDYETLENQYAQLENAEKIKELISFAKSIVDNDNFGPHVGIKSLSETYQDLSKLSSKYSELNGRLLSLKIELDDILGEIENEDESLDFSEEEALAVKERYELIESLKFKHNCNEIADLKNLEQKLISDLNAIEDIEEELVRSEKELDKLKKELLDQAQSLAEKRKSGGNQLVSTVKGILNELSMPDAEIQLEWTPLSEPSIDGIEKIDLLFKTNRGGGFLPVKKVASGGELARLMLSLLSVISDKKSLPTLIFDEIDTGVSGEVAAKMARQFEHMGQNIQIIAITHLAQVAARGKKHLHVFKSVSGDRTATSVQYLNNKEARIQELAKIMSGERITEAARQNAEELMKSVG